MSGNVISYITNNARKEQQHTIYNTFHLCTVLPTNHLIRLQNKQVQFNIQWNNIDVLINIVCYNIL